MLETTIARSARAPGEIPATGAALAAALGVPMDFWTMEAEGPRRIGACAADGTATLSPETAEPPCPELVAFLGSAAKSQVLRGSDGGQVLALRMGRAGRASVVAAARLDGRTGEGMAKAAELFLENVELRNQVKASQAAIDSCAVQMEADFEELTFLRKVAEYIEIGDLKQEAWALAERMLPPLASLIHAECLVLVPAEETSGAATAPPGRPVLWLGPRPCDEDACRRLIEQCRTRAAVRPLVENRFRATPEACLLPGVSRLALVQLVRGNDAIGWLAAFQLQPPAGPAGDPPDDPEGKREFGTVEAGLMESVAAILATHVRNVQLFRQTQDLLLGIIRGMVSAIDAKDPYTCGHGERVALMARRIGQELGMEDEARERLYLSGLMHDLGKLAVPDAVLAKPGRLTDEEFAQIRPHPERGWAILAEVGQLSELLPGVLHHHERFDGAGYPDGLAGEQIPLLARILAVADSYDAMTSDRPYRKGMPEEVVSRILREGAGSQWDPRVIEAHFRALGDIQAIATTRHAPLTPPKRLRGRDTAASPR